MTAHTFLPTHYFNTMGAHVPVLHLESGDTVTTFCLDARGRDADGRRIVDLGNPLTGPFFINGAEPGDTLVVRLERIIPSRLHGWSGWLLASHLVDSHDMVKLADADVSNEPWHWDVDTALQKAKLNQPSSPWHGYSLELAPMLGCLGVAPARGQAISSLTSGNHGGNMDYRGFRAGSTAYFPVFDSGALLFLGDGHALQGDGEIIGTGIEISVEVEFSVRLVKHQRIHWPRGENAEFFFTVGNARPLDQCVQHATSEMLRWLNEDYGMDVQHASLLMGLGVRYDLGNVMNPAYTVACKMPKDLLSTFQIHRLE